MLPDFGRSPTALSIFADQFRSLVIRVPELRKLQRPDSAVFLKTDEERRLR